MWGGRVVLLLLLRCVVSMHPTGGGRAGLAGSCFPTGLAHALVCCACLCSCSKVFTADEVADTVVGILDKLGVKEACVVGHSYGTVSLQDPA